MHRERAYIQLRNRRVAGLAVKGISKGFTRPKRMPLVLVSTVTKLPEWLARSIGNMSHDKRAPSLAFSMFSRKGVGCGGDEEFWGGCGGFAQRTVMSSEQGVFTACIPAFQHSSMLGPWNLQLRLPALEKCYPLFVLWLQQRITALIMDEYQDCTIVSTFSISIMGITLTALVSYRFSSLKKEPLHRHPPATGQPNLLPAQGAASSAHLLLWSSNGMLFSSPTPCPLCLRQTPTYAFGSKT